MLEDKCTKSLTRRHFLQSSGLIGTAMVLPGVSLGKRATDQPSSGKRARNLIFCVSDGMNIGTLQLSDLYARRFSGKPLAWPSLYNGSLPFTRSLVDTASANSPVTDSAAAASAWGIGIRCNNGAINVTPSGKKPAPVCVRAKEAGKLTGLVTTATVTHATPAGFAANMENRSNQAAIAEQYLERKIDLILGGGSKFFDPTTRKDGKDLFAAASGQGYRVCRDRAGLLQTSPDQHRVLGTFSPGHLNYDLDRQNTPELSEAQPTLAEMSAFALERLVRNPKGFVLQIEGARIDHAGHVNDPAAIIHEQIAFDQAVHVALDFYRKHPEDTLLVITTDHGTGGCTLNGVGSRYTGTGDALDNLAKASHSLAWLSGQLKPEMSPEVVAAQLQGATGLDLPADAAAQLHEKLQEGRVSGRHIADALRDTYLHQTGVGWTSHNHTAEPIEQTALGPGSEQMRPYMENHQVHDVLVEALALA